MAHEQLPSAVSVETIAERRKSIQEMRHFAECVEFFNGLDCCEGSSAGRCERHAELEYYKEILILLLCYNFEYFKILRVVTI